MVEELAARLLDDDGRRTVSAFPDGSVDTFYAVVVAGGRLDSRSALADIIAAGHPDVLTLDRRAVEPGGHAVNVAAQAHCLGNDVTLAGHLDNPVFDALPFEFVSMGEPASVDVFGFDEGDLLTVENSADVTEWSLADLEAALGDAIEDFLTADAVCCTNWTSVDGLPAALAALADRELDGSWFVVDPGSVAGKSDAAIGRLFDALGRLTVGYDVVLAGNEKEVGTLAGAIGDTFDGADDAVEAIREAAGLSGVVVHATSSAAVATPNGVVSVANFDVDPVRHTGGGDRFDAGLAHALSRGWDWEGALVLGNACASRYVATGDSASPAELAAFLRERQ